MTSEVVKSFKSGFVLSEQDLRRVWNCCEQHFSKLNAQATHISLEAILKDASVVTTESIDHILKLENGGAREIRRVNLSIKDAEEDPKHSIEVSFRNAHRDSESWVSMWARVRGEDRDWAFLAADEIEDRLKRLRRVGVEYLANHRLATPIVVGAGFVLMLSLLPFLGGRAAVKDTLAEIQTELNEGQALDAAAVMVRIEQAKQAENLWGFVLCVFAVPAAVVFLVSGLLPKLFCSYHFCWGEYTGVYERRRSRAKVFWVSGLLAVLASIIAGLILKHFYS